MLQNAYFLAKIGADTAENEQHFAEILPIGRRVAAPRPGTLKYAVSRPAEPVDPLHRPVRGDLAHIRCAGHVFVPHYAVPMPHVVLAGGAALRKAGRLDAEVLTELAEGAVFNVLDMAGEWAWGQQGEVGFVGYVPLSALVAA